MHEWNINETFENDIILGLHARAFDDYAERYISCYVRHTTMSPVPLDSTSPVKSAMRFDVIWCLSRLLIVCERADSSLDELERVLDDLEFEFSETSHDRKLIETRTLNH